MIAKYLRSSVLLVGVLMMLGSCKKDSLEDRMAKDDELIVAFLTKNNIQATKHSSGVYYKVITPGTGKTIAANSTVSAVYEGRLLTGAVFQSTSSAIQFALPGVIQGWQIGVPLIKEGGEIRLIIPSPLAYGEDSPSGAIPANAVLDFTLAITKVH